MGLLGLCMLAGCGPAKEPETGIIYHTPESKGTELLEEDMTEMSAQEKETDNYYILVSIDTLEEKLVVLDRLKEKEYEYHFGLSTRFLDKYGDRTTVGDFKEGAAVVLGEKLVDGVLSSLQLSDQVWTYTDIVRFSYDTERSIIQIADKKYRYDSMLRIFSNGNQTSLSDIKDEDVVTVVGDGHNILSIDITTGHGTLALTNTELFEDSYLQLDNSRFLMITKDMKVDLPEGKYTMAIANDGWGSTNEITISRGETTTIDCDAIKGEGPKYAQILFAIGDVGAALYIDNEMVEDYTEPLTLKYGYHKVKVVADGKDEWSRTLYVNSPEATVEIGPIADTGANDKSSGSSQNTGGSNGNSSGSGQNTGGSNGNSSGGKQNTGEANGSKSESGGKTEHKKKSNSADSSQEKNTEDDYLKDYLTTLSEMLNSLT